MIRGATAIALLWLAGMCASRTALAEVWSYQYRGFEVVAEGSAAYARSIAQRLDAIDAAMLKLLRQNSPAAQLPTRVLALNGETLARLESPWARAGGVFKVRGPLEHVLVLRSENEGRVPGNRELLAARAAAWLDGQGLARLPDWFRRGLSLIIATAEFDNGQLVIGQVVPDYLKLIQDGGWISTGKLLLLPASDPEFTSSPERAALYDAECWWLAHVTFFEGVLERYMPEMLARQMRGEDALTAYSLAFGIDFESLDRFLRRQRHTLVMRNYRAPQAEGVELPLAAVPADELQARLAQLAVWMEGDSRQGVQLANEALARQPLAEHALCALAEAHLAARRVAPLLEVVAALQAMPTLTAGGRAQLALTQAALARLHDAAATGLQALDPAALRAAARAQLRQAMADAPDDPLPVYHLGTLLAAQGDVRAIREFLPHAEAAFRQRPYNGELAGLLVRLHVLTGDRAAELRYALVEQRVAATPAQRLGAARRVQRLRPQVQGVAPEPEEPATLTVPPVAPDGADDGK